MTCMLARRFRSGSIRMQSSTTLNVTNRGGTRRVEASLLVVFRVRRRFQQTENTAVYNAGNAVLLFAVVATALIPASDRH